MMKYNVDLLIDLSSILNIYVSYLRLKPLAKQLQSNSSITRRLSETSSKTFNITFV